MYNVKGPSKIVAKTTRRGPPQNIDNFRDHNKNKIMDSEQPNNGNVSKPIFHKKYSTNNSQHEVITPHHEEIIKYINESWNSVYSELETSHAERSGNNNNHIVTYFQEEPSSSLQDFKPFDLESWWGKRLYAYITSSIPAKN
ncbi:unnamed protein product [Brassicogethes aeneus]|uniref:Uncharacterized protein n=1 Tax=Brassicogethes aeneus TaxID=1431903 RepID=A0A9P0FB36_BRAAE|nr:unnamed protein product [Brassicogethes aeneus]